MLRIRKYAISTFDNSTATGTDAEAKHSLEFYSVLAFSTTEDIRGVASFQGFGSERTGYQLSANGTANVLQLNNR